MANIGTDLNAWSTTEASNQPDGTDSATIAGDLRAIQAGVRNAFGASDTIASATTCDLGSKSAGYLTISGTTTITSLGSTATAGLRKTVTFSGALTLTHHATNLILPTSADITTVAGDHAEFICTGSGTWTCLWYAGKSGRFLNITAGTYDGTASFTDTTDATSSTAAALKTAGGLAVAKKINVGTSATIGTDCTLTNGNLILGTSGTGIDFSATSGTGSSELFSDYEEGTWTPTISSTGGSITTYTSGGAYTKVGRLVTLHFVYTVTNNGTGSGAVNVSGVPFNIGSLNEGAGISREIAVSGATGSLYFNGVANLLHVSYNNAYPSGTNYQNVCTVVYKV